MSAGTLASAASMMPSLRSPVGRDVRQLEWVAVVAMMKCPPCCPGRRPGRLWLRTGQSRSGSGDQTPRGMDRATPADGAMPSTARVAVRDQAVSDRRDADGSTVVNDLVDDAVGADA